MWELPDPRTFNSLLDLIEDAANRYAGREQMVLRTDEGTELPWSAQDVAYHSKLVGWRLRQLGIQPGDRLLTWSPSTPALPAVYFGAARAGVVIVPLDLRMAPDVLQRIAASAGATWMAIGTGFDAPDPQAAGLEHLEHPHGRLARRAASPPERGGHRRRRLTTSPSPTTGRHRSTPGSGRRVTDLFEVIYTSGTTGVPKGVMLEHGTILATLEAIDKILPPREHRTVSLLPASHLFEQAPIIMYGTMIGAHIMWLRSRTPRVIFEAFREERVTTMVLVPQLLELFWMGLQREVRHQRPREGVQARPARRPLPALLGTSAAVPADPPAAGRRAAPAGLGRRVSAAGTPGELAEPGRRRAAGLWRDGVRPGGGDAREDHPTGTVGKVTEPVQLRLAEGSDEILIGGATVFEGYWQDPAATAAAKTDDGWYRTGDVGRFNERGNLVLLGRTKNIIVLPNGLNVYPEDIENVLADVGLEQAVVLETAPGRIEAVVLSPDAPPIITPNSPAPPAPHDARRGSRPARPHRAARSARRTHAWASTSASTTSASGPRPTSRAPTRSRSSAPRCSATWAPIRRSPFSIPSSRTRKTAARRRTGRGSGEAGAGG